MLPWLLKPNFKEINFGVTLKPCNYGNRAFLHPFLAPHKLPRASAQPVCEPPIKGDLLRKVMSCFSFYATINNSFHTRAFHSTSPIAANAGGGPPKSTPHKCWTNRKK